MAKELGVCVIILEAESVSKTLLEESTQYAVKVFRNFEDLLKATMLERPIAFFFDLEHTGKDQLLAHLPQIRENWPVCPLFVISGEAREDVLAEVLRFGIDDFVLKPLQGDRVRLRLNARHLQRSMEKRSAIAVSDLVVDPTARSLKNLKNNKIKYLSPIEINLLSVLLSSMGQAISRERVKRDCWGTNSVSDNALNRKLFEVRKALQQIDSELTIKTLYGSGYALQKKDKIPKA
ncbi:MAG: response regulator transcription factor [Deltaproteobacteria bacterium]|nr:response regulator transcription factor [Deltaproteobacteria bacterium]